MKDREHTTRPTTRLRRRGPPWWAAHFCSLLLPLAATAEDACPLRYDIPPRPATTEDGGIASGDRAEIVRGAQQARADQIEYDGDSSTLQLMGDVHLWDEDSFARGEAATVDFEAERAEIFKVRYVHEAARAHGEADHAELDFGTRTILRGASYTTCAEGSRVWTLHARQVTLDHEDERGQARHAVLRVKGVPILYTPWLSFPLGDTRKSGFLAPSFGNSRRNGLQLALPWYWNIAPNRDVTIIPRLFSDNGIMWQGEYRYLLRRGQGQARLEYLPGDDRRDGDDRSLFSLRHEQTFLARGRVRLDFNRVSDADYFSDFGNQLSLTSTRFLDRLAEVHYGNRLAGGSHYDVAVRLQGYQSVDPAVGGAALPYKRLPQIVFNYRSRQADHRLNYGLASELVYFDRRAPGLGAADVSGLRLALYPYLSYPLHREWGFLVPKLGLRYTQYQLRGAARPARSPSRITPLLSLDSGLFFERSLQTPFAHIQTLEPRLYYLYIPEVEQDDLPIFDTAAYTFDYGTLFYEDRFAGRDRLGDTHQLAVTLRSDLLRGDSGRLLGGVSIGQIFYLKDRVVTLPGEAVQDDFSSPLVVTTEVRPVSGWSLRGDWQWDPHGRGTDRLTGLLRYTPAPGKVLNLGYRSNQVATDVEQTDVSLRWPITARWSVVGRWNYALPAGRSLETFGGVEYNGCCLAVRAVARRFLADTQGAYQNGLFLNFELKGLTSVGGSTVDFLRTNIPGYEKQF